MASGFYVGSKEAVRTLNDRTHLRHAVEQWWGKRGYELPSSFLCEAPIGFIGRQLAAARYEDCAFVLLAERAGLTPVWTTYVRDKFVERSPLKYSYVRPCVVTGFDHRGMPIRAKLRLADPKNVEGRRLEAIMTIEGANLVEWHRAHMQSAFADPMITDLSYMYMAHANPRAYYPLLLSLAVAHGVYFEDYHGGESGAGLDAFTRNVFEPAFGEVTERFGVSPLIVPLPWWKELGHYVAPRLSEEWRSHVSILKYLL